jgi:hypothetical protein
LTTMAQVELAGASFLTKLTDNWELVLRQNGVRTKFVN